MIVIPTQLNTGTNKGYNKSQQAEHAAALLLASKLDLDVNTLNISTGYAPGYDFLIEGSQQKQITFEVKYTGKKGSILVEYARADESILSGIQVNKSNYTIFINRQSSRPNGIWIDIGKMRLYKTSLLLDWTMNAVDDDNYDKISYPKSSIGPGSSNVILNPKEHENELPHLWIGDVKCDDPVAYHMDRFIKTNLNVERDKLILDWNF